MVTMTSLVKNIVINVHYRKTGCCEDADFMALCLAIVLLDSSQTDHEHCAPLSCKPILHQSLESILYMVLKTWYPQIGD